MMRYCLTQCKRLWRILPVALCITALLLGGMAAALLGLMSDADDQNQKIKIAVAGQTDHTLLQLGFAALSTLDNTRFSMEVLQLSQEQAKNALRQGDIAAYVVVPEGFMDKAIRGELTPLTFVSHTNSGDLVALFKAEVTRMVSQLVVSSQQGVFGMAATLREHGLTEKLPGQTNKLALQYVDYILLRDDIYAVEELGISNNLDLGRALACGLSVLLVLLMALPFAPVVIAPDGALARMLHARRLSAPRQILAEFAAYALTLTLMTALPAGIILGLTEELAVSLPDALWRLMPVLFCLAALSFALYSLTDHLIGGVLAHFFATVALCFVSGCLYPIHFFPISLQQAAAYLPTGLARAQIAGLLTGADTTDTALLLWGYGGLLLAMAVGLRLRRIKGVTG